MTQMSLLYHVYAEGEIIDLRNVEQILPSLEKFNRVIFKVVSSDPDLARSQFNDILPRFVTIKYYENDPVILDAVGFHENMEELLKKDGYTMYGHTKATRADSDQMLPYRVRWAKTLITANVSQLRRVRELMDLGYYAYGVFKIEVPIEKSGLRSKWHYPGTYWWVNNDVMNCSNWDKIPITKHTTELLLSHFIDTDKAYSCVKLPYTHDYLDLNNDSVPIHTVLKEMFHQ